MKETKFIRVLSVIASVIAVCMYVSYIPQISLHTRHYMSVPCYLERTE